MCVAATRSEIEFTPDVQQLAQRLEVAAELPNVLEMTQDVFPDAAAEVAVAEDPEITNEVCLAIVVRTNVADGHELFQMARPWHRRIFDCCRPDQVSAFRLDTGWRS